MSTKLIFVKSKRNNSSIKIENKLNINNFNFPFFEKLNHHSQISIIGEIKNSPSLGKFTKENINLIDFAKAYEDNNISCISVLQTKNILMEKLMI